MRYLITPSLMNSWERIWEAPEAVRDSESDPRSLEDRQDEAREEAYAEFLAYLRKEPREPNEAMIRGMEYEEDTYKGLTDASPYVEGGLWQVAGKKRITVDGTDFLMYGRLDCLKGGIVYDIKRVGRYEAGKYRRSHQHGFYLELFPECDRFTYLAYDGRKLHEETYWRDQTRDERRSIGEFARWLKANGLWDDYEANWKAKGN